MINNLNINETRTGFSLIELMVTVSIIALLSVISVVSINVVSANARDSKRLGDVNTLSNALGIYYIDNGQYPNCAGNDQDYGGAWTTCLGAALAPYISVMPKDPGKDGFGYSYYKSGKKGYLTFYIERSKPNSTSAQFSNYDTYYGAYKYTMSFGL
jgi:general secretion pathway protein G